MLYLLMTNNNDANTDCVEEAIIRTKYFQSPSNSTGKQATIKQTRPVFKNKLNAVFVGV